MSADEMKQTLFHFCKFYEDSMERMLEVGNNIQRMSFADKYLGVMAVINSLKLADEYETYKENN